MNYINSKNHCLIGDFNIYINSKNHCLIGDFNINIMSKSLDSAHDTTLNQDFLNHLLEHEYTPCFLGITRPDPQNIFGGSCIDNMYLKTKNLTTKAYKITTPFTDYYPLF